MASIWLSGCPGVLLHRTHIRFAPWPEESLFDRITSRANGLFIFIKTIVLSLEQCADPTESLEAAILRLNLSASEHLARQSGQSTVVDNLIVSGGMLSFVGGRRTQHLNHRTGDGCEQSPGIQFSSTIMSSRVL